MKPAASLDLFPTPGRMPPMQRRATFSPDGRFRYDLARAWDRTKPIVPLCMVNPSTAGADRDDPTVQRVIQIWTWCGWGGFTAVNLHDLISTDPDVLRLAKDPVSPGNDALLDRVATESGRIVCAWGLHGAVLGRDRVVVDRWRALGVELLCFGLTKDGAPKHPLARGLHRIPDGMAPVPFGGVA